MTNHLLRFPGVPVLTVIQTGETNIGCGELHRRRALLASDAVAFLGRKTIQFSATQDAAKALADATVLKIGHVCTPACQGWEVV